MDENYRGTLISETSVWKHMEKKPMENMMKQMDTYGKQNETCGTYGIKMKYMETYWDLHVFFFFS